MDSFKTKNNTVTSFCTIYHGVCKRYFFKIKLLVPQFTHISYKLLQRAAALIQHSRSPNPFTSNMNCSWESGTLAWRLEKSSVHTILYTYTTRTPQYYVSIWFNRSVFHPITQNVFPFCLLSNSKSLVNFLSFSTKNN